NMEREVKMSGSGVILEKTKDYLYMITNHHVIDGARDLSVTFSDDKTYAAEVVKYDENNDIAIIRVRIKNLSESTLAEIKPIKIGDSNSLEIGESVVAIGNALGYGQSVTTGVVSAVNRNFAPKESLDTKTYIQTDAAINPGNSGGALLNMKGELVGINTAKIASSSIEGMGYAIPMARVLELIKGANIDEFQENALNL
ncbi:MAG: S1C family serine protease, partial [Ezakiella sp.]